jgi:hypothetical protein
VNTAADDENVESVRGQRIEIAKHGEGRRPGTPKVPAL